ncbi:helix-turn-helix domain-containing protein (plasmid) [Clostridium perfringens]|uniref:helix-turn-helix domain-containing protein n=1 Tax=Clostridium perfringens TaxID=1502 RepID=UPI0039E85626
MNSYLQFDKTILHDNTLTCQERMVYAIICSYETIKGFKTSKGLIAKEIGKGYKTTQKILSRLRELGLVSLKKIREGSKYIYYYVSKAFESKLEVKEVKEEIKEVKETVVAPKDSDGNAPINGQVHINEFVEGEILEVEKEATKEGLNADLGTIREAIEVADNYDKKITNRTKFILGTIRNLLTNKKTNKANPNFKKQKSLTCHNFSQREYDWESLESELLGYGLEDSVTELENVETNNDIPQLPSFIGSALK